MHAIFSRTRRVVVVVGPSLQRTKLLRNQQPALSQQSQRRHFLSHLLPSGLVASSSATRSEKIHGFFATTLRNNHLKLESGNASESRAGFFGFRLPSKGLESEGFTGFQKRGWKSWIHGANGVVFGLIIANAAVFTLWKVSDKRWMTKHFVLSLYSVTSGHIHTLITPGFSHIGTSHFVMNMIGLFYFGTNIARTFGPLYLLKLYFAGTLASSVYLLSEQALMATLKSYGSQGRTKPIAILGADGSVFAITLLDILLYPKVTTYFDLMLRVPALLGVLSLGGNVLQVLEGKTKTLSLQSTHVLGGAIVAAIAWKRIRKGRFY
ncbi:unnamed protein product [Microthlaspi erraticum]|uniref:Peptidase S54 rhomboid domain-containing protein n=1 Tax=Microthlaspi erraticum TaxID=1685480 RepID=A0A6D2K3S9_9BRAS|nr:unnamed protein product [Microthlaspi erraticum]